MIPIFLGTLQGLWSGQGGSNQDCAHHGGEHRPRVLLVDQLFGDPPGAGSFWADWDVPDVPCVKLPTGKIAICCLDDPLQVWFPMTVCTNSRYQKLSIQKYLEDCYRWCFCSRWGNDGNVASKSLWGDFGASSEIIGLKFVADFLQRSLHVVTSSDICLSCQKHCFISLRSETFGTPSYCLHSCCFLDWTGDRMRGLESSWRLVFDGFWWFLMVFVPGPRWNTSWNTPIGGLSVVSRPGAAFKLHDFGFRGVSSVESAAMGGLGLAPQPWQISACGIMRWVCLKIVYP